MQSLHPYEYLAAIELVLDIASIASLYSTILMDYCFMCGITSHLG